MANSKKKCKHCGEYKPAETMIKVPAGTFCCFQHATEFAMIKRNEQRDKINNKLERADRKRIKDKVKELRPLSWYHKKAQAAFNAYIRRRDAGLPCISCGRPDNGTHQRHASHYRSVGAAPQLRYNEDNVHASCSVCNNHLSGNIAGYTPLLIKKIGEHKFNLIKNDSSIKAWTREELQKISKLYNQKAPKGA